MRTGLRGIDHRLIEIVRRRGLLVLRLALGVVFLWFGLLKVVGRSPVADLVAATAYWFDADFVLPALGALEILVGAGLITGIAIRLTLLLFFLQMAGTLLVFVINPGVAFRAGNPFLLTTEGEFVVKNLVLVAAGIAVGATVPKAREHEGIAEMLARRAKPAGEEPDGPPFPD